MWIRCPKCSMLYGAEGYSCPFCGAGHPAIHCPKRKRIRHVPLRYDEDGDDDNICDDIFDTHSKLSERGCL